MGSVVEKGRPGTARGVGDTKACLRQPDEGGTGSVVCSVVQWRAKCLVGSDKRAKRFVDWRLEVTQLGRIKEREVCRSGSFAVLRFRGSVLRRVCQCQCVAGIGVVVMMRLESNGWERGFETEICRSLVTRIVIYGEVVFDDVERNAHVFAKVGPMAIRGSFCCRHYLYWAHAPSLQEQEPL